MHLFYAPNIAFEHVLPEEESQHAVRVLRLHTGDEIIVVDGAGGFHKCIISNPHPKKCTFEIVETRSESGKKNYKIHLAIAPTKIIERFEWFLEKATEIGIDEITPIICRFSERKILKPERLEKMIVSAAKQSLKAYFPKLNPVCTFNEFIAHYSAERKFIAHCYDEERKSLKNACEKGKSTIILIGPEGDFSQEEVKKAIAQKYLPVTLGNSRLRTETAGVVACHTVNLLNEE